MPDLVLDYAAGQVDPPFRGKRDDQQVVNDFTAERVDGGEHQLSQPSGPRGTNAIGVIDRTQPYNVEIDQQLSDIASWRLGWGTLTDKRYTPISVNVRGLSTRTGGEALVDDLLDMIPGDRIVVQNPPDWLPGEDISQVTLGYDETLSQAEWRFGWHTAPDRLYTVGQYAADPPDPGPADPQRYSLDLCETGAAFDVGVDTELEVVTTRGAHWVTTSHPRAHFPMDIMSRGVRLRTTAIESSVLDTFSRTETAGWGSPDVGPGPWLLTGVAADFDVAAGVGSISESTTFAGRWAALDVDYGTVELLASIMFQENAPGDGGIIARAGSPNQNSYEFTISPLSDELHIGRYLGGAFTLLDSTPFDVSAGVQYWLRARCASSTLLCKAWQDGDPEPDGWMLSTTDSSHASGRVGVEHFGDSGNLTVSFDNFEVVNPQLFTTNQSPVNGVVPFSGTIPAGSPVGLWTPARYGL